MQRALERYDGGRYSHYLIKRDRGGVKLYLKEGLYTPVDGRYQRLGQFTRDGLITLEETGSFSETQWGRRRQPITLKFPAFGKRYQEGASVVITTPHINVSDSGTISVTTDVMTMWRAGSNSRPNGAGLVKGPFSVLEAGIFEDVQAMLSTRDPGLTPKAIANEKLYGLFGHGHFKGFNYESGLFLLSQKDTRQALLSQSGTDLARSLSLLFLGDKEVKQALKQNLAHAGLGVAADAIDHVKGIDFAETRDGKPTSALGRVALGLTLLAEGHEGASHAAQGSLAAVRQTVAQALRGDERAVRRLQTQARKLVEMSVSDPKQAIRFSDGSVIINEGSLIARGAGLMAHVSFIGNQLFNPHVSPGASVGRLFERNLGDVTRYLNDVGYRNTVDAIAGVAGITLPSPEVRYQGVIQRKLSLLQSKLRNDFVLQDLKDITVSSSLVPTGMKDEAAFEYQYLAGMSISYLNAFTKVGGGSEAAKQAQRAFAMMAGSARLGLPGASATMEYRLAFPVEGEGFLHGLGMDTQRLLLGYTSLGRQMGLFSEALTGLGHSSGPERASLLKFINLQRIATGFVGDGGLHLEERAVTLNRLHGFKYFADSESAASRLQLTHLTKKLGLTLFLTQNADGQTLSPFKAVNKVVRRAYEAYIEDRHFRRSQRTEQIGFQQFVAEGRAGAAAQALEEHYGLISDLTQGSHRIAGVPFTTDAAKLDDRIQRQLARVNQRSTQMLHETLDAGVYKEFVEGALSLENELQGRLLKGHDRRSEALLSEVRKTKQIVLPQFDTQLIPEQGRYQLRVLDPEQHEPSVGVMLGTDVLRKVSLNFPQYTDEALRYQVDLRQKLIETEELRGRIFNHPHGTISEAEKLQLQELQSTMENSRLSVIRLLDTDLTRKAMGDRQKFDGAVGTAIASFSLDAHETVLGKRFQALAEGRQLGQVFQNQFKLLSASLGQTREQQVRAVEDTRRLINSVGLRGSDTLEQSQVTGISSRSEVDRLFEESLQAARSGNLNMGHLETLKLHTYSAAANVSRERIQGLSSLPELNNLLSLSVGSIRRGGAPAGSAALTTEYNFYEVNDVINLQERIRREGGGLIPDAERFKTGMAAPAVGRLLSMLGDFDGDAYQFLLTGVGDHASRLTGIQQEVLQLNRKLSTLEAQLDRRFDRNFEPGDVAELHAFSTLSEQIEAIRGQVNVKQAELTEEIARLDEYSAKYDRLGLRALKDVRQWVGSYLALPDFVTEEHSGISTGHLMSMVQQMSGTLPQIEDAARHFAHSEQRMNSLHQLFDEQQGGFQFSEAVLHATGEQLTTYTDRALGATASQDERDSFRQEMRGMFAHAQRQRVTTKDEFLTAAQDYLAFRSNLSMTVEQVNKSMKKAAGLMLNPLDFEGVQSLIGQAGTELIGKTYNALIPMLDQAMFEHALITGLGTTGDNSFRTVLGQNLTQMAGQAGSVKELQQILDLHDKLFNDESLNSARSRLSAKFAGTSSTLSTLQQLIRDALKEKSEKGIVKVLREASFEGKPLIEALETVDASDPVAADKLRTQILNKAVSTQIGPDLSVGSGLDAAAGRLRMGQAIDPGITGFGALLKLAQYTMTDDSDLHQRFVVDAGAQKEYERRFNAGEVRNVSEFAASQVRDLVERAQASFLASTYSEGARDTVVNKLRQFGQSADPSNLSSTNSAIHQLMAEYEAERLTVQHDSKGLGHLDSRLLQEVSLLQVQGRNREQGVMSIEQIKDLREFYSETQKIRFDAGGISEMMMGSSVDTYNAYLRVLQRGQQPHMTDALHMAGYRLDTMARALQEHGLNPSTLGLAESQKAARILGLRPGSGFLNPQEQQLLTRALMAQNHAGVSGIHALQQSTAAMTQGVFSLLDEMEAIQSSERPDLNRVELLQRQLNTIMESGTVNVDRYQRLGAVQRSERSTHVVNQVQQALERVVSNPFARTQDEATTRAHHQGHLLSADPGLEVAGAFAAPVLMAVASSNLKLDDRVIQFGFDTLQAVASINTQSQHLSTQLMGGASHAAALNFSIGRIRQSMDMEGFTAGAIQGLVQEGLFKTFSSLSHSAIESFSKRVPGAQTRAGNAIATVAAEIGGTLLALGFSRSMVKQRTMTGDYVPDRLGDLLKQFTDQIWQMAEQVQLDMLNSNYEVTDTSENENFDFETSAIPSQLEQDIESGLIVLDEEGNPLPTEFSDTSAQQASLAMGV